MARYDEKGRQIPDPTPVEWPLGLTRPRTLAEEIQRHIRGHVSELAAREGYETEEEANDFEVGDDWEEPLTAYEVMGAERVPDYSIDPKAPSSPVSGGAEAKPGAKPEGGENAAGEASPEDPAPNPAPKSRLSSAPKKSEGAFGRG